MPNWSKVRQETELAYLAYLEKEKEMWTTIWLYWAKWRKPWNEEHWDKEPCQFEKYSAKSYWVKERGPMPTGIQCNHYCDRGPCTNTNHMWLGTQKENMQDCSAKGRLKGWCGKY